jgi:hypothetical protein
MPPTWESHIADAGQDAYGKEIDDVILRTRLTLNKAEQYPATVPDAIAHLRQAAHILTTFLETLP